MRSGLVAFSIVAATLASAPAPAAGAPRVNIPAGRLATALTTLGRQMGVDILFADELVGDRTSPAISGRIEVAEALDRVLAGTGLTFRVIDGAYVIVRAPEADDAPPQETIPEILVLGRRAQNGDIRRTRDDIQPYQVYGGRDVQRAQSRSIDDFARSRLPANAQIASPAQTGSDTRSEINLRGLGANQTLMLVDGRRLPSLPNPPFSFNQPDVNAIPVEMIDRIEVLTATAGGVYGTGAISGMVNVVLRRDYRGGALSATAGISARGDAFQSRLFGRFGFTPDGGRTDVMLAFGTSRERPLLAGRRDFLARAVRRRFANAPDDVLTTSNLPIGNGINILGAGPLSLDPEFGGTELGARFTTLPLGLSGDVSRRNSLLVANAGTLSLDLAPGVDGETISIEGSPVTRSIFLNVRHDFGGGVEAVLDILDARNSGRRRTPTIFTSFYAIAADRPINPFQQTIFLAVPVRTLGGGDALTVNETRRVTASIGVPLPGKWRANAEVGLGRAAARSETTNPLAVADLISGLSGRAPLNGGSALDPLGDWAQFEAALASYADRRTSILPPSSRLRNFTLRVAGPVLDLPGGTATLSLLAEERRETVAAADAQLYLGSELLSLQLPRLAQRVRSVYGEARVPLTADRGLLSRLELQLALRQDWTRSTLPGAATIFDRDPPSLENSSVTTLYTLGTRISPVPGLTLRASTTTGALPPATSQLGSRKFAGTANAPDLKRGGRLLGTEVATTFVTGGRVDLRPERSRSMSLGLVITPGGSSGPRLSLDFTRIMKRDEIVPLLGSSAALLLANEASYPDRLTRAPLSDADRLAGFSAGPVTQIDLTTINLGSTRVDALDLSVDQTVDLPRAGELNAYLRATWEPSLSRRVAPGARKVERVGYFDGPLEWRGNAGLDWTRDRLTVGINGQFYSRYRIVKSITSPTDEQTVRTQGARYVPSQFYADLYGTYRLGRSRATGSAELRLGISNVFDSRPPTVVDPAGLGYSFYGDPRRRRVQLSLEVPFAGQ
jgi:outer membrane receptor protein involved in Fe transport